MEKGNKIIQCGGCGKKIAAKMHGNRGYAICPCGNEYRIKNDNLFGMKQELAKV